MVFGNVSSKKLVALSQLGIWDAKERKRSLTIEEREVRRGWGEGGVGEGP